MKKTFVLLLLLSATAALAADAPREIFPSDYKPLPCAPANVCESFKNVGYASAARAFLMREVDMTWYEAHRDELLAMTQPYCAKRATCMATPGNDWMFCNDVFTQELRASCSAKYPVATHKHEFEECLTFVDVFTTGVDQRGSADWRAAQKCTEDANAGKTPPVQHMEWWTSPAVIPIGYTGTIQIFAINTETHVPVQAIVAYEDQILYSKDSPSGRLLTYYKIPVPTKTARVPNAAGHTDIVPPMMTLTAPGYETVNVRFPATVPALKTSISPDVKKLVPGKTSTITVTTIDATTGKPAEMQVMVGDQLAGMSNQPIEVKLPKGRKRPEIWVTSPFDVYSDVVVSPAVR